MIRRDYILRMLAEFFEVLSKIRALQRGQKWGEATGAADKEFQSLVGDGADAAVQLSETELLAQLIKGESTLAVREKTLILATLFKEAGDIAAGQGQDQKSGTFYLKGLHLLLSILSREAAFECPEFVPRVESFLSALAEVALPMTTQAMLMQHYERLGDFARAEDILFSMIEDEPNHQELLEFGIGFYQRIRNQSDDALVGGNLPRGELEASLAQLVERRATLSTPETTDKL